MSWQNRIPDFYKQEISSIRRRFPDVEIKEKNGQVILAGIFPVGSEHGSTIRQYHMGIVFPRNYPKWIPATYMLEPDIPRVADRHFYQNGQACLCLPHEVHGFFPDGINFNEYFDRLLKPWLIGQTGFDDKGYWPFTSRDHGMKGILQGFSELLKIDDPEDVLRFFYLLIRKNSAKGGTLCPCGSGRKLRDCHSELFKECREKIPEDAMKIYRKLVHESHCSS